MRIVHVLTRLLRAGSEENTIETALWQASAGHEVAVVHGHDVDPYWQTYCADRLRFVSCEELIHPLRPAADLQALAALRRIYRELSPDVIHTHQSKAGILGRFAARAVPNALVVHGIHIIPFDGLPTPRRIAYLAAEKLAARRTDLMIAVSRGVAEVYAAAGISTPIEVVHSGMQLESFRNARLPADRDRLVGDGAGAEPVVALMLASLEPRKRHLPFLSSLAAARDAMPNLRLILAGTGPLEDAVWERIVERHLEKQVLLCGYRRDPGSLIALADVLLLTSQREGLPRVVIQALAGGKPVIVTDLPGLDEVVTGGQNGLVADATDLSDIVGKLRRFCVEPELRRRLSDGARKTDLSDWDLSRLGPRTTALYERALAARIGAAT